MPTHNEPCNWQFQRSHIQKRLRFEGGESFVRYSSSSLFQSLLRKKIILLKIELQQ